MRRRTRVAVRAVALLVAIAAVPGCWLQAGGDAARRGLQASEPTLTAGAVADGGLEVAWTAAVGGPAAEPIVRDGLAFVRTDGAVTALDIDDGTVRWRADGLGGRAAPAWAEGRLWVPASGETCDLVGLDPATGARATYVTPFGGGEDVAIVAASGTTACTLTDALVTDGQVVSSWHVAGSASIPLACGRTTDIPLYLDGAGLVAHDIADGTTWDTARPTQTCGSPAGAPRPGVVSASGDVVVVPLPPGILRYARAGCGAPHGGLCPATGESTVAGEVVSPAIGHADRGLAWITRNGTVMMVDAAGNPSGEGSLPGPATAPLAAGRGRLLVSLSGGLLTYPSAGCTTGCSVWGGRVTPPNVRPTTAGDLVWVGAGDGTVAALREAGCGDLFCDPVWQGDVGAAVAAPPVVDGGTLLVADTAGTVTAYRLTP